MDIFILTWKAPPPPITLTCVYTVVRGSSQVIKSWFNNWRTSQFKKDILEAGKNVFVCSQYHGPFIRHSVTRFGEISPLLQKLISLVQYLEVLFVIKSNFEPVLANFKCYWAHFNSCKGPNIKITIKPSGHTEFRLYLICLL